MGFPADLKVYNRTAYRYLNQFRGKLDDDILTAIAEYKYNVPKSLLDFFKSKKDKGDTNYNPKISYGDMYHWFSRFADYCYKNEKYTQSFDKVADLFYLNSNQGIELSCEVLQTVRTDFAKTNKTEFINKTLQSFLDEKDKDELGEYKIRPKKMEKTETKLKEFFGVEKFKSLIPYSEKSDGFCSQWYTNIPYAFNQEKYCLVRMGLPLISYSDSFEVSPKFKAYLKNIQAKDRSHLYFSDLKESDLGRSKPARHWEAGAVNMLKNLDLDPEYSNFYLVVLPADEGLLDSKLLTSKKKISAGAVRKQLLDLVLGQSKRSIKDFYLSPKVCEKLFKEDETLASVSKRMLDNTFKLFKIKDHDDVTLPQVHAICNNFFKYQLKNYITEKFIFTENKKLYVSSVCKDDIDRGWIEFIYYKAIGLYHKILELDGKNTSEPVKELFKLISFDYINAAAFSVKGRLMNHHYDNLLNALVSIPDFVDNLMRFRDGIEDKEIDSTLNILLKRKNAVIDSSKCELIWNSEQLIEKITSLDDKNNELNLDYCKKVIKAVNEYIDLKPEKLTEPGEDHGQKRLKNLYDCLNKYLDEKISVKTELKKSNSFFSNMYSYANRGMNKVKYRHSYSDTDGLINTVDGYIKEGGDFAKILKDKLDESIMIDESFSIESISDDSRQSQNLIINEEYTIPSDYDRGVRKKLPKSHSMDDLYEINKNYRVIQAFEPSHKRTDSNEVIIHSVSNASSNKDQVQQQLNVLAKGMKNGITTLIAGASLFCLGGGVWLAQYLGLISVAHLGAVSMFILGLAPIVGAVGLGVFAIGLGLFGVYSYKQAAVKHEAENISVLSQ